MTRDKTCCFTGHRVIPYNDMKAVERKTAEYIRRLIDKGVEEFIAGGAAGFDMLAERLVLCEKKNNPSVKLKIAVPCPGQDKWYRSEEKELYKRILSEADEVIYVSDMYYSGCMQKRNRYMADRSAYLISYCTKDSGGSYYTKRYALRNGLFVLDVI